MDPTKIKMVCVMPCYDKKLEAVRPDFKLLKQEAEQQFGKEVDTVLATHELLDLFQKTGIDFGTVGPYSGNDLQDVGHDQVMKEENEAMEEEGAVTEFQPLDKLFKASEYLDAFKVRSLYGRTSNGYLEYIFRRSAKELFGVEIQPDERLNYK